MTHDQHYLPTEVAKWKNLRSDLLSALGPDFDDQALFDTLDGETNLIDALKHIMKEARYKAALAEGARELAKETAGRAARLEATAARMRAICLNAMADADIKKIEAPDFTMSRQRATAGVVIQDPDAVPDEFCRITREPSKSKIAEALKSGADLPFAFFGNATETLVVRGS